MKDVGAPLVDPSIELFHQILLNDENTKNVLSHFKDQIVVDLGAGIWWRPYSLMCLAEARAYIGVEKFWAEKLKQSIIFMSENVEKLETRLLSQHLIPYTIEPQDMLEYLQQLSPQSVSIFNSGMDWAVLDSKEYRQSVGREIERVLHPKGAYISFEESFPVATVQLITNYKNIKVFKYL